MLQRPGEAQPWNPQRRGPNTQCHGDANEKPPLPPNYFSLARFYCVETICAPCGVVIAWTKFDRSESATNILHILESVYLTQVSHPDYICINKTMEVGMQYGKTQQDSSLILSTILPIILLIFFAEYITILPLVMVQLHTLSSLSMMTMDVHMLDKNSIPKYVNN